MNPTDHIITLDSQIYAGTSLATETSSTLTALSYSPKVVYNASKPQISISITAYAFKFLTDAELNTSPAWTGTSYDSNNVHSANEIIESHGDVSQQYNNASPYVAYRFANL